MQSFLGYSVMDGVETVEAAFKAKFGRPPERIIETSGAILAGPITHKPGRELAAPSPPMDDLTDLPLFGGNS